MLLNIIHNLFDCLTIKIITFQKIITLILQIIYKYFIWIFVLYIEHNIITSLCVMLMQFVQH